MKNCAASLMVGFITFRKYGPFSAPSAFVRLALGTHRVQGIRRCFGLIRISEL